MTTVVETHAPDGAGRDAEWRSRARELVARRFERSVEVPTRFFEEQADAIARACLEMARRFQRGGRLLVFGEGAQATDAQHVSVEFVHPVIVGKRALPAVALTSDVAVLTGATRAGSAGGTGGAFARALEVLGRSGDIALGIDEALAGGAVLEGLRRARELGMLTVGAAGGRCRALTAGDVDFLFVVPSADPLVVQEVHETLYHVLWELVHVFFEHGVT